MNIVFESPTVWHKWLISYYLLRGYKVWVIEPFHAYHHQKGKYAFFPPPSFPEYINRHIKNGDVHLLRVDVLAVRDLSIIASDEAVSLVEKIFPEFRKDFRHIIEYACKTLDSAIAENIFKKRLCDRLAVFYSVNIMLQKMEKALSSGVIRFYPETNMLSYFYYIRLISRAGQRYYSHDRLELTLYTYLRDYIENIKHEILSLLRLIMITIFNMIPSRRKPAKIKKKFRIGIAIVGPSRQLRKNKRRADFIVDDIKIRREETIYFPVVKLTNEQKMTAAQLKGEIYYLPGRTERHISHFGYWLGLVGTTLMERFMRNADIVGEACRAFLHYFIWKQVTEEIKIAHFVTHCDFGPGRIARNIALSQAGVETWYFSDSMNHSMAYADKGSRLIGLHPFWTYLNYDHFVTWNEFMARYYMQHPGSMREACVVGCLWSDHIRRNVDNKGKNEKFVVSAFDSTYSRNGITSYQEGITFAEHLLRLVEECPDVYLAFKEKKSRNIHFELDAVLAPRLVELYQKMSSHPRIKMYTNQDDAADIVSNSSLIISFPFTSVTFEALSANRPAVWHDPKGYYRNTPYARAGGVTTHNYDELKKKVLEVLDEKIEHRNPMVIDSPLMDPYRDGKAIERFRNILAERANQ